MPPSLLPPLSPVDAAHRVTRAPRRSERLFMWLIMALILLLVSPALLIEIGTPQVIDTREAAALNISIQSYQHHHLRAPPQQTFVDRLVPVLHEKTLWTQPPAVYWQQQLSFLLFVDSKDPRVESYVFASRLASAFMGLIALASVFWAGACIGGFRTGGFAALVCGANPTFLYHARLAETTIYYVAWASISIAAALWALRPLRPQPSVLRQALGWAICGIALGMAILCVGPGAMFAVAVPVLLIVFLCPGRAQHLMGLVAAVILAILVVLPWATYAQQQDPNAWPLNIAPWLPTHWLHPLSLITATLERAPIVFIALLPWCLWLVGAMVQPFSTSSAGVRVRLFIGWSWFLLAFVIAMASSPHGEVPTLIAVIPAGAILVAQTFHQYADLASEGRFPRLWRVLRWPHIVFLTALALAVPVVLQYQNELVLRRIMPFELFTQPGWIYSIGLCIVLLVIVGLSVRWAFKEHPAKSLVSWAVFTLVLCFGMTLPLTGGPASRCDAVADADLLTKSVGKNAVVWLPPIAIGDNTLPDPMLTLYVDRDIPRVMPSQLADIAASRPNAPLFVLTSHDAPARAASPSLVCISLAMCADAASRPSRRCSISTISSITC